MGKAILMLLTYPKDKDLFSLYETVGRRDFNTIMKDSLKVLLRPGYTPKTNIPTDFKPYEGSTDPIQIITTVNKREDEDVRQLLSHIEKRQISNFVKYAMRLYIDPMNYLRAMLNLNLIKTAPIYTPSGVIVLGDIVQRPVVEKKQRIAKINKQIAKTTQTSAGEADSLEKENIEVREESPVVPISASIPRENPLIPQTSSSIPQTVPAMDPMVMQASEFGFEENDELTEEEDDILALLEGLM